MDRQHRTAASGGAQAPRAAPQGAILDLPDWNEALRAPGAELGLAVARTPAKTYGRLGPPQVRCAPAAWFAA